jgi:hypothetical protein
MVRRGRVAVAIGAVLAVAGPAAGQSLHGVGELQYQSVDRAGPGATRESWVKSFQTDYSRRLPGAVELASRFRFTEQTVVGRPDRLRVPEASVRLAHRNFGLTTAYRPSQSRNAQGLIQNQQNLTLTGYAQRPGLPSLAGSWVRTHVDSSVQSRESATVTRSLSSNYTRPGLSLHAGFGDRHLERPGGFGSRRVDRHFNLGSISEIRVRGTPVSLRYDFTESWADPTGIRSQRARGHTAGLTSGFQVGPKAATSLAYTYHRSTVVGVPGTRVEDHNGTLSLSYLLAPAISLASSGGVRSALSGGRTLTERFASAGVAAQATARPGWQVSANAGRTYGWLPATEVRVTDQLGAGTTMRLANGLDARANLGLTSARRPEAGGDSIAPAREVGLQMGAGITAVPLRRLHLDLSAQRSRAGASTLRGSPTSTSYAASARLALTRRMQTTGGWSRTRGFGSQGSTVQGTLVWNAGSRLQLSGGYARATQTLRATALPATSRQESLTGALTATLGRLTTASFRYSESNHGQPSQIRQVNVNLVRRFGR